MFTRCVSNVPELFSRTNCENYKCIRALQLGVTVPSQRLCDELDAVVHVLLAEIHHEDTQARGGSLADGATQVFYHRGPPFSGLRADKAHGFLSEFIDFPIFAIDFSFVLIQLSTH